MLEHPWFKDIDIEAIKNKTFKAEHIPVFENIFDTGSFLRDFTASKIKQSTLLKEQKQMVFKNYEIFKEFEDE